MNNLIGLDPYYILLNVPITIEQTRHTILTTFNKTQARVAQDILNQAHDDRIQWATQMLNFLVQTRVKGELQFDTCISATLKQGGIIVRMPVNLHWRAMRMLSLVCLSGQEPLIRVLSDVLRNVEAGLYPKKSTINPFDLGIKI